MTTKTKTELTAEFIDLMNQFEENQDDFNLAMALNDLDGEIEQKADQCAFVIQELGEDEETYKARKKYYDGFRKENADAEKACHNKKQRLHDSLLWMLKETGKTDFMTENFKFKVGGVGGKRGVEYDCDDANTIFVDIALENPEINDAYLALKNSIKEKFGFCPFIPFFNFDKDAVRSYLELGGELPFATLAEKKEKVRIK